MTGSLVADAEKMMAKAVKDYEYAVYKSLEATKYLQAIADLRQADALERIAAALEAQS